MTVDRNEQRTRIAEVTVDVIAREGFEAATIRKIAAEVGCSTSIVTYYFADKQELLASAYRSLYDETYGKFNAITERDPTDLVSCLLCMTAADEVSFKRWRTYVAFWDQAARDPIWAAKGLEDLEFALGKIEEVVQARNRDHLAYKETARNLNALIQGISVQALINPAAWPVDKIRSTIAALVDKLLGPPSCPARSAPQSSARSNAALHGR